MESSSMKGFEHLEIQLEEIKSATNNFDEENIIGDGGFGKVYKGELFHSNSRGRGMVALKRLNRKLMQGEPEFYKEVRMLSCYKHENIISLLGFSRGRDENHEMVLVYEYASRGSLDNCLKDVNLTWTQRLKICLDAAKGLSYLHDPRETSQRLIHCDIKSANILLDENFKAKVADFGLSKISPANQQNSILVTDTLGTPGYCDPAFMETYTLSKESDTYSFGVVLFEVLSGKLCYEYSKGRLKVIHVPKWKRSYEVKELDRIILEDIKQQMNPGSLATFSDIAYQCLKRFREERPAMSLVVKKLQESLALQELHDLKPEMKYEEIVNAAVPPLNYRSLDELKLLLTEGFHVNEGKTLFRLNEKGDHIELIFIEACLNPDKAGSVKHRDDCVDSRFPGGRCYEYEYRFEAHVRAEYLSPHISYTVNLVFRYRLQSNVNSYNPLRYKIGGEDETKLFIIYPIDMRQDGWFIAPLYQFTSQHKTADLQFEFEDRSISLLVAGIEFQPSDEKVELQVFEEYQHWQNVIKAASQSLVYRSLQELKQILFKGIHLKDYKTWFSLTKDEAHCEMISMEDCLIPHEDFTPRYKSHQKSRFPAGLYQTNDKGFKTHVKAQLLSPKITYTVNLVYNSSSYGEQVYVDLKYRLRGETTTYTVYLAKRTDDEFMRMVELYQFTSDGSIIELEIIFENSGTNIDGVEGILFQPLEIVENQVSKDDKVENIQTISDSESDTYWEQKFPNDYEEILNLSKDSLMWTTKKELYSILRRGFLINNGQQWFAIDKHGKKCLMLSARATWVIDDKNSAWKVLHETRFGEVLVITAGDKFKIKGEIKSEVVSPKTNYASYLVYKLPQDQSTFEAPMFVWEKDGLRYKGWYIYLVSPPLTPVIGSKIDENNYNPLNRYKGNVIPQQRSDGWMEVKVWEFQTNAETVPMHLKFKHPCTKDLSGLMVQGIELRPI